MRNKNSSRKCIYVIAHVPCISNTNLRTYCELKHEHLFDKICILSMIFHFGLL